jgi:hypothetical protein
MWYKVGVMQTLEFTRALLEIVEELQVGEMVKLLQGWLPAASANAGLSEDEKDRFQSLVLSSHSGFDRLTRVESTRKILEKLKLGEVYEASRLRRLVTAVSSAPNTQHLRAVTEFYGLYEALRAVLRLQATCRDLLDLEKVGTVPASDSILELQVIDYEGQGIEPNRLAKIISLLTRLHSNIARVLNIQGDTLTIKYFDSGSDVILGLQAAKAIIATLGPLFLQFWDKVRFRHHETFDKDLQALSKGLEFMGKVQEAVANNTIDTETGEIMKVGVFRSVAKLVKLGVTLPLRDAAAVDQRQLLVEKRDVKLLGSGPPVETDEDPGEPNGGAEPPGKTVTPAE